MAVENRLNLAAGCGAQRISRRCRDARPLGLAATRRAQVIATPSERRLRQGREAAERTLDGGEHRGDLRRWARPILRQIYALFDRRQQGNEIGSKADAAQRERKADAAQNPVDKFRKGIWLRS